MSRPPTLLKSLATASSRFSGLDGGSRPQKVTSRSSQMAYEPSFAPDGRSMVFESHEVGNSEHGRITLLEIGGSRYVELTGSDEDCRQPNWSPRGGFILYQKQVGGRWDIS